MKLFKIVLLAIVVILAIVVYLQYPRLNIIAGYAAKNMSSNVFLANRPVDSINAIDNAVPSIKLAKTTVDFDTKITTSSVFGLLKRKVLYREGQGAVVIDDDFDIHQQFLVPKRSEYTSELPFPYGNGSAKDTVFSNVNYTDLQTAVDSAFIENHRPFLKKTRSVVVIYKDQIIAEKYAEGFDQNTRFLGWSMAKSVLATTIGVLEKKQGFDIHKPISELLDLKEWQQDNRASISTHHLLKMTSGLKWEEDYTKISDVTKMLFLERDMTKAQASKALEFAPGSHFNYSSGTTNLMSGVLRSQFKTHQEYLDFPYTELIDKIGMHSMVLETDMAGNYVGSSYAWATARDWAKFGLLYAHKGNWNGTQVFNDSWAEYTAKPTAASNYSYGSQFRTSTLEEFPNVPKDMYFAYGYHGQFTIIIPSMDLVVIRLGLTHEDKKDIYTYANKLIKNVIYSIY